MKTFKLLCLLSILSLGFASCSSDDDDPISKAPILGTWQINSFTVGDFDFGSMLDEDFLSTKLIIENDSLSLISYERDENNNLLEDASGNIAYTFDGTNLYLKIESENEEEDLEDPIMSLILDHLTCVYENNSINFRVRGLDPEATIATMEEAAKTDDDYEGMATFFKDFESFDADIIFLKQE